MKKKLAVVILSLSFLTLGSAFAQPVRQQELNKDLLSRKIQLHLKKATLMQALSTLSVDHRVPLGIEYSPADKNEAKLELDSENYTLPQILDSITAQEPLYRWEITDGVVNIRPSNQEDPFFKTLLNVTVSHFYPGKGSLKFQLRDAIGDTPEVKRLLESHNKTLAKYEDYVYYPSIYSRTDIDLKISNVTVRTILNRIVRISEHKQWSIAWRDNERRVLSIRL